MARRVTIPVKGGLYKSVRVDTQQNSGTTISGFDNQIITLDQLRAALGLNNKATVTPPSGGGTSSASLILAPGLVGGGPLVGAVPLRINKAQAAAMFVGGGGDDEGGGAAPPGKPGKQGPAGPTGSTGAAGTPGGHRGFPIALVAEPEEPLPSMPVRGRPGPTGATGPAGPVRPQKIWLPQSEEYEEPMFVGRAKTAVASSSSGLPAVPGAVPNLLVWLATDKITGASGSSVGVIPSVNPALCPVWPVGINTGAAPPAQGATIDATLVNGLPVLAFPNSAVGDYQGVGWNPAFAVAMTFFAVINPLALTGGDIISGAQHAMNVQQSTGQKLTITDSNTAVLATSTSGMTSNVYQQIMVQWLNSSKVWTFRIGRASAGTGTAGSAFASTAIPSNAYFYNGQVNSNFFGGKFAEMLIYNRVLTSPEIALVEAYLLAKWGV